VFVSHHVPNIGNAITPFTMGPIRTTLGWAHPSNTSAPKPFPWYWLLLTAQWTFWYCGVSRSKTTTILMKLGWLCATVVQKKIGRRTANINTKKTLEVLSLLRPIVQRHISNSINHLVSSCTPLGHGCNMWLLLHPWPNGVLEETKWLLLF